MKIRIKGNTLRLRLSQEEVSLISAKGSVEETIQFSTSKLTYALEATNVKEISGDFKGNRISVRVPEERVKAWASTDQIGFDAHQEIANGDQLYILIEKDFKCSIDRGEDESDLFDPPTND